MLDPQVIDQATGLTVAAGRPITRDASAIGSCLWAASTSEGVEVTVFPEEPFRTGLQVTRPGFQLVPGIGLLAKDTIVSLPSSNIKVAALSADFGTYGVLVALNSSRASLAQVARLGTALK